MILPPVSVDSDQFTVAYLLCIVMVAVPIEGALATVKGVTDTVEEEYDPIPAAFTAATVNV